MKLKETPKFQNVADKNKSVNSIQKQSPRDVKQSIDLHFLNEFNSSINSILNDSFSDFLKKCISRANHTLKSSFNSKILEDKSNQEHIKTQVDKITELVHKYKKIFLKIINDFKKNPASCEYIKDFTRKHCFDSKNNNITHTCRTKFITIKESNMTVKYVICPLCQIVFLPNALTVFCNNCKCEYPSQLVKSESESYNQFITYDKSHCTLKNYPGMIKCQKCKDPLMKNFEKNEISCLKCKIITKTDNYQAKCKDCNIVLSSDKIKIFDYFEEMLISNSIKDALILRNSCFLSKTFCICSEKDVKYFKHSKLCEGELFHASLRNETKIVCSECQTLFDPKGFQYHCKKCLKSSEIVMNENKDPNLSPKKIKNEKSESKPEIFNPVIIVNNNEPLKQFCSPNNKLLSNFVTPIKLNESKHESNKHSSKISNPFDQGKIFSGEKEKIIINKSNSKAENMRLISLKSEEKIFKHQELSGSKPVIDKVYSSYEKEPDCDNLRRKNSIPLPGKNLYDDFEKVSKEDVPKGSKVISSKEMVSKIPLPFKQKNSSNNCEKKIQKKLSIQDHSNEYSSSNSNDNTNDCNNSSKNLSKVASSELHFKSNCSPISFVNLKADIKVEDINDISSNFRNSRSESFKKIDTSATKYKKEFLIEDFRLLQQLGEGSFGTILLAENNKTKEKYAIKKIIVNNEEEFISFANEYDLIIENQHKNILKIFGKNKKNLDFSTFVLYILMELANSDWDKEIKLRNVSKKYYTENELFNILKQITSALSVLQEKGISHRDIKPQNILVFDDNIYKIADFGEAKLKHKQSRDMDTLRGTELYMSPMLFNTLRYTNKNNVVHNVYKSDVFSLGYCMIFAATLNLKILFELRAIKQVAAVNNHIIKNLEIRGLSKKFIDLILKMVELDESKRFDFKELEEYLKTY